MTLDKEEVQKQHEAAKDYIISLKEEVAAAKAIMNSALQVNTKFNMGYQCPHEKDLHPSKFFLTILIV